ncbi:MAG: hypothetical protein WCZ65_07070 [Lysobacteraceae bacterium]
MKTLALLVLTLLPFSAYGSRPIMKDESLACISGGMPSKPGELHSVSFSNGYEMDVLHPDTLASAVVLKSWKQHSATFKVDGMTTQTINFSFKDFPDSDICFRYDNSKETWSVGRTPKNVCQSCSLKSNGT